MGTPRFPADVYVRDMGLRHFDGVLIVTAGRFTEVDLALIQQLSHWQVPFYVVRNKVDQDIESNLEDNGIEEEETVRQIKRFMSEEHAIDKVYAVSARKYPAMTLDFDVMMNDMLRDMSQGRARGEHFPTAPCPEGEENLEHFSLEDFLLLLGNADKNHALCYPEVVAAWHESAAIAPRRWKMFRASGGGESGQGAAEVSPTNVPPVPLVQPSM